MPFLTRFRWRGRPLGTGAVIAVLDRGRAVVGSCRVVGIVKLTKSSSSDPQDTGLQSVANPPYWAPKAAVSLNLTIPPKYYFDSIKADDVRTKLEKSLHGLLDENHELRSECVAETKNLFEKVGKYILV